ncbi:hypothetical protein RSSM_06145 [Rhodopirellula sallentina SM41]|uniref:Uncharacterized protein n=1 Tax=Rhodopirellula sallentina SM41 TaxID=1263870 RepID=M5U8Y4_9BACT|nr:hypothetical protein RSSM_06145 [Rhodopirellula sallentina SM41]
MIVCCLGAARPLASARRSLSGNDVERQLMLSGNKVNWYWCVLFR